MAEHKRRLRREQMRRYRDRKRRTGHKLRYAPRELWSGMDKIFTERTKRKGRMLPLSGGKRGTWLKKPPRYLSEAKSRSSAKGKSKAR